MHIRDTQKYFRYINCNNNETSITLGEISNLSIMTMLSTKLPICLVSIYFYLIIGTDV